MKEPNTVPGKMLATCIQLTNPETGQPYTEAPDGVDVSICMWSKFGEGALAAQTSEDSPSGSSRKGEETTSEDTSSSETTEEASPDASTDASPDASTDSSNEGTDASTEGTDASSETDSAPSFASESVSALTSSGVSSFSYDEWNSDDQGFSYDNTGEGLDSRWGLTSSPALGTEMAGGE